MKKGIIIGIIIGGIIFGSLGVLGATYLYHANEVSYTPSNSEFNVDNVESAITELYNMQIEKPKEIFIRYKNGNVPYHYIYNPSNNELKYIGDNIYYSVCSQSETNCSKISSQYISVENKGAYNQYSGPVITALKDITIKYANLNIGYNVTSSLTNLSPVVKQLKMGDTLDLSQSFAYGEFLVFFIF